MNTIKKFLLLLVFFTANGVLAQTNLLNTNRTYSVIIAWDANTETNLAGYNVYYGTASGFYTTKTNVGNVTTNRVSGLWRTNRYFFVVTAYDTLGMESDPSNEITTQPPAAPRIRVQSILQAAASPLGPWSPVTTNEFWAFSEAPNSFFRTWMAATLEP